MKNIDKLISRTHRSLPVRIPYLLDLALFDDSYIIPAYEKY